MGTVHILFKYMYSPVIFLYNFVQNYMITTNLFMRVFSSRITLKFKIHFQFWLVSTSYVNESTEMKNKKFQSRTFRKVSVATKWKSNKSNSVKSSTSISPFTYTFELNQLKSFLHSDTNWRPHKRNWENLFGLYNRAIISQKYK